MILRGDRIDICVMILRGDRIGICITINHIHLSKNKQLMMLYSSKLREQYKGILQLLARRVTQGHFTAQNYGGVVQ